MRRQLGGAPDHLLVRRSPDLEEIDRNRDGTADARTTWHERPDDSVEERTWDGAQLTGTKLYRFDCR